MKKIIVTDEKIFRVYKDVDRESNFKGLPTHSFWEKAVSIRRTTPKIKFCHKKSTLPVR